MIKFFNTQREASFNKSLENEDQIMIFYDNDLNIM